MVAFRSFGTHGRGSDLTDSPHNDGHDDWAIRAEGLGKHYELGELTGGLGMIRRALGRGRISSQDFAALHDVDLVVKRGECLGIVGENGSGKSTLLNIASRITVPTSGWMEIRGRVLPLLAVGSGFHPELTGRENAELLGAVLGIPRQTILARLADIASFAEIEQHFETPVKRYSDGMQARLSFALAVLFPADIYIFDEVLAVIDPEFRERCLGEIGALSAAGQTVIIVTHDSAQLRRNADRVLWMHNGRVERIGEAGEVLDAYLGAGGGSRHPGSDTETSQISLAWK
jgi:ABC-type polysaccharide/polyol phosphate transport system ATPase subunit